MANHPVDVTFQRFGKLVAIRLDSKDSRGINVWLLRCDCGALVSRRVTQLVRSTRNINHASCGCSHHLKTHGLTSINRKLHWVWIAMRGRCQSAKSKDFKNYGARGIAVCPEWEDFRQFHAWAVASGYRPGLTIERNNVNGDYEPGNCTWIENEQQALNRRNNHQFTFGGKTQDIRAWSDECAVPYYTLRSRLLNYGWDIDRAINTPVRASA